MTGMIISNPLFMWMLPLAGLPILFHLFLKLKKRQAVFSSLMFFNLIDPKLSARRKMREWLVLILRMLFIAFILLALARPVWRGAGAGGTVAMVIVVDNSGSMCAPGRDGRNKLAAALDAAAMLLTGLNGRDLAGIVLTVEDPAVSLPDGLVSDKTALKSALSKTEETEATGSAAGALRRALSMLDNTSAAGLELHILSDLQSAEWNILPATPFEPPAGTRLQVHRIPPVPETSANISLAGITPPPYRLIAGRRVYVHARLINTTPFSADIRLNSLDDQNQKAFQSVPVPPNGEKDVEITLAPALPGVHWLTAWIEGDSFSFDNRAAAAYTCTEMERVVFIGAREDFALLPIAIDPADSGRLSGLIPVFTNAISRPDLMGNQKPVLLIMTWNTFARAGERQPEVKAFVEYGGNLLVLPSPIEPLTTGPIPDWAGAVPEQRTEFAEGLPLLVFRKSAVLFRDLADEKGDLASLRNIKIFKGHPLRLTQDGQALMGLPDGRPVLVQQKLGKGTLFTCGLAFDSSWSILPLKGGFVALAQAIALATPAPPVPLVAGDRLSATERLADLYAAVPVNSAAARPAPLHLLSLAGTPLDWKGAPEQFPAFAHSGVYTVQTGTNIITLAIRSSDREGRLKFLPSDSIPVMNGLNYTVKSLSGASALGDATVMERRGRDLYLPFLLLAMAAWIAEGWLANPKGASRKSQAEIRSPESS
ncbi:MAG: BatA and WFA domain-containing protein [Kiritimatiellae bacterium]|nr:BatA and WFA domain-containing protein [Kiritimatiellia bacterium]